MSTVCKIDKMVRIYRYDRAAALRDLERIIPKVADFGQRTRASMVYAVLCEIHDDPALTGSEKDELFKGIIHRLQEAHSGTSAVQSAA